MEEINKETNRTVRANLFMSFLAILLSIILGYSIYSVAKGDENDIVCLFVSSICLLSTLIPIMGYQYSSTRLGVNIRILCVIVFIMFMAINFSFAGFGISMPAYIIANGIVLVIYLAILYKINSINNV